jgi:hypothetical protein
MTTWKARLFASFTALFFLTVVSSSQVIKPGLVKRGSTQPVNGSVAGSPSASPKWALLFPKFTIDQRWLAVGVYDTPTNSLIVFGGANFLALANDVMSLSNANGKPRGTWTTVIPNRNPGSPDARVYHSAVYDEANSRMVVFGGCDGGTTYYNDVWVLTNANGGPGKAAWEELSPNGAPPIARCGHAAVYDVANNRMIVYGGSNAQGFLSDVWVLSNANGLGGNPTWTQLSPQGNPPDGRDTGSVVYDAADNILIQFAGAHDSSQDTNSVFTLSNANGLGNTPVWTQLIANGATGSPGKRDGHVAFYDSANNRMTIFGGDANTPAGFPQRNDVWVLTNANGLHKAKWHRLSPAGVQPSGRVGAVGAYDSADNRLIIYGGASSDSLSYGTWVLTDANGR